MSKTRNVKSAAAVAGAARGSVCDPIGQINAVRGLVDLGKTVEAWRAEVKRRETELLIKLGYIKASTPNDQAQRPGRL